MANTARAIRVVIDGPSRRRDTLVRHLGTVGANARPARRRYRDALRDVFSADVVQRTLFIEVDYPKSAMVFGLAKLLGRRTVRYWVGTDVWLALRNPRLRRDARLLDKLIDLNVVVAPHLQAELASLGIRSVVLLAPQDNLESAPAHPLPKNFTVLTYTGVGSDNLYRIPDILRLAERNADMRFVIVGGTRRSSPLPNVSFPGTVDDMERVYANASVLLRLVQHDGLPRMVLEALARERPVIYSQGFPHCIRARDVREVEASLRRLRGGTRLHQAGREFVRQSFSAVNSAHELRKAYAALMSPDSAHRIRWKRRPQFAWVSDGLVM